MNDSWYADANFVGLHNSDNVEDPVSAESRTGWLVTLAGIPVTWASNLQGEVCLSTMEAEYVALSTGMRELVGMRNVIKEIGEKRKISCLEKSYC